MPSLFLSFKNNKEELEMLEIIESYPNKSQFIKEVLMGVRDFIPNPNKGRGLYDMYEGKRGDNDYEEEKSICSESKRRGKSNNGNDTDINKTNKSIEQESNEIVTLTAALKDALNVINESKKINETLVKRIEDNENLNVAKPVVTDTVVEEERTEEPLVEVVEEVILEPKVVTTAPPVLDIQRAFMTPIGDKLKGNKKPKEKSKEESNLNNQ